MKKSLPLGRKMGYGLSELGTTSTEVLIRLYLLIFYTDIVGLSPRLAGYAVALAVVWDAVTDPLMGVLSDATRTRFGKRRPYIVFGGLALAFSITLLFSTPVISSTTGKFLYLLGCYILVNTSMTIITVPHAALGRELTFDANERTEVYGWRLLFGNFGFLTGTILPGIMLTRFSRGGGQEMQVLAHSRAAEVIAAIIVVAALGTFFSTRGLDRINPQRSRVRFATVIPSLFSVLRNRIFLPLFLAYFIATVGLSVNSTTALYFYRYRLQLPENQVQLILGVFIFVFCVSLVVWVLVSRRLGKKMPAFWASLSLGILTSVIYPLAPPGKILLPLIIAVVGGFLVGSIVLLESLVADTVDYDELKTGSKREGIYFGFWKMSTKIARAGAIAIAGNLLHIIGYVPNAEQLPEVNRRLGLIFGPGVGFFMVAGALVFLLMPLTSEMHERIQQLLLKRRSLQERFEKNRTSS
jgi:GPH family glycoside/pentoside/hexuronide:cation symporter